MDITPITQAPAPDWMAAALTTLKPLLRADMQLVCKAERPEFGVSARDEVLGVQIGESESVKTTMFETDGDWEDGAQCSYADGWVKTRKIRNWSWVLIENAVNGTTRAGRVVRTLYVRDARFYLEVRRALGLPGH